MAIIAIKRGKWSNLSAFAAAINNSPWLVTGYFNAIRCKNSRLGGSRDWHSWMGDCDDCCISSGLFFIRSVGSFFTWSNRREQDPILKKLDRVLVNAGGESSFSGSEASFLPAGISDHTLMIIKLAALQLVKKAF